jgi:hypothetical protein
MRKNLSLVCFFFLAALTVSAQGITVNEEPNISRMMEAYMGMNKAKTEVQMIDGFRIQLAATTDRRKVDQMIAAFSGRYPGVPTAWQQAQPYYRVRVGAFTSRDNATKYLQTIKKDYPDAYIVMDKFKQSELMN